MKNIKLTTIADKTVLLNWDNVTYVKATSNHFGDNYSEIHLGEQVVDVKQTIAAIEDILTPTPNDLDLLEEEASQHYVKSDTGTVTERLQ